VDPKAPVEDGEAGVIRGENITQQQQRRMPFIDIIERRGLAKGLLEGIEKCLKMQFGDEGLELMPELRELRDHELLRKILARIDTAASSDDLRRIWTRKRRSKTAKPT
jgi:hypothetical protein